MSDHLDIGTTTHTNHVFNLYPTDDYVNHSLCFINNATVDNHDLTKDKPNFNTTVTYISKSGSCKGSTFMATCITQYHLP